MYAFIIFRDRMTYAKQCVTSMLAAGLEPVIIDHGTSYPPAVDWLRHLLKNGIQVIDVGGGHHPRSLWDHAWFRSMCGNERYVVTDPDVVPSEDCPLDWPHHLSVILDNYPRYHKAGLGLRIDRIPDHYLRKANVINWESTFVQQPLGDGVFQADIDTTLALHVPVPQMGTHSFNAVRTGPPYMADHLAWYEDLGNLTEEQAWYHEHAEPGITFWTLPGRGAGDQVNSLATFTDQPE